MNADTVSQKDIRGDESSLSSELAYTQISSSTLAAFHRLHLIRYTD